jgi:hypothetical protein
MWLSKWREILFIGTRSRAFLKQKWTADIQFIALKLAKIKALYKYVEECFHYNQCSRPDAQRLSIYANKTAPKNAATKIVTSDAVATIPDTNIISSSLFN